MVDLMVGRFSTIVVLFMNGFVFTIYFVHCWFLCILCGLFWTRKGGCLLCTWDLQWVPLWPSYLYLYNSLFGSNRLLYVLLFYSEFYLDRFCVGKRFVPLLYCNRRWELCALFCWKLPTSLIHQDLIRPDIA
jgi:hypothetical protein